MAAGLRLLGKGKGPEEDAEDWLRGVLPNATLQFQEEEWGAYPPQVRAQSVRKCF